MIEVGPERFDNLHGSARAPRNRSQHAGEVAPLDSPRATTSDQNTAWLKHIDCRQIQAVVGAQCSGDLSAIAGHARGIEHHGLELLLLLRQVLQIIKAVGLHEVDFIESVVLRILVGLF